MLMNVRRENTTAAITAPTQLALLSASAGPAIPYRVTVQHVQVCRHSCQPKCVCVCVCGVCECVCVCVCCELC